MNPPLIAIALGLSLLPPAHPQLPSAETCEVLYAIAVADRAELVDHYHAMTGVRLLPALPPWEFPSWDYNGGDGGWQAQQLREFIREADRVRHVWTAARALRQEVDSTQPWAERLRHIVGDDAYWRGELPLPLSVR